MMLNYCIQLVLISSFEYVVMQQKWWIRYHFNLPRAKLNNTSDSADVNKDAHVIILTVYLH